MATNRRVSGKSASRKTPLGNVEVPADRLWGAQTQRSHLEISRSASSRYRWGPPRDSGTGDPQEMCRGSANGELGPALTKKRWI